MANIEIISNTCIVWIRSMQIFIIKVVVSMCVCESIFFTRFTVCLCVQFNAHNRNVDCLRKWEKRKSENSLRKRASTYLFEGVDVLSGGWLGMPSLGTMRHVRVSLLFVNDELVDCRLVGKLWFLSFWLRKRGELFPRMVLEDHLHM